MALQHVSTDRQRRPIFLLASGGIHVAVAACAMAAALLVLTSEASAQPSPGSSADVQSNGPLKMSAPSTLVLGTDTSAKISLQANGAPVELFASVGSLSEATLRDGRWEAIYSPPSTRFPQVAIIAATTADRKTTDFVTVALHGRPTLRIDSEPRAQVHVKVGDETFGPVKLNRKGKGAIQITVPPGVESVSIISADRLGNKKVTPRQLGVPPFQQLLAICPTGGHELILVATNAKGEARPGARLQLATSVGALDAAEQRAPGIYSARFRVDSSVAFADSAELTASMPNAGQPSTVSCTAEIPREAPNGIQVSLGSKHFVAGSGTPVEITIKLSYRGKRLPQQVLPTALADFGTVSALEPITQTEYRAQWILPDEFIKQSTAELRVRVEEAGIDGAAALALQAGPIANLSISSSRSRLRADGEDSVFLTVEAQDSHGNQAPTDTLKWRATAGQVGPLRNDGTRAGVRYRGPRRFESGRDTVTVRSETGQEASLNLLLDPLPRRFLANARMGFTTNFGAVSTMAFAADASLRLAYSGHDVAVGIESGYFTHNENRSLDDGGESVELDLDVVPLLARLAYEVHDLPVQLYVGGSGGVLFTSATIQSDATGMRTESTPSIMVSGLLGARKRLGPGLLGIEAAYWHSRLDEEGISGSLGGLRITAGYGFDL